MEQFLPPDDPFVFRGSQSTHVEAAQDVPYISADNNWIGDDTDDIEHVDWIGVEMPDELASEESGSCDNAVDRPRKRVRYGVIEEEYEVLVGPEREALYAAELTADDRIDGNPCIDSLDAGHVKSCVLHDMLQHERQSSGI